MSKNEKPTAPAAPGEVKIVSDLASGKVVRIEMVLSDGAVRTLYPLTPEEAAAFEQELTATRH